MSTGENQTESLQNSTDDLLVCLGNGSANDTIGIRGFKELPGVNRERLASYDRDLKHPLVGVINLQHLSAVIRQSPHAVLSRL